MQAIVHDAGGHYPQRALLVSTVFMARARRARKRGGRDLRLNVVGYWFSDKIALRASRAKPVRPGELPQLEAMVADLADRAQVPVPGLYLIPSDAPNAFATGRNPQHAAVAVTQGLLAELPAEEVRGVLAHELGHIKNATSSWRRSRR
jgi:heat shock protein HtpX